MTSSRYFDLPTLENSLRLLHTAVTGSRFQTLKIAGASGGLKRRSGITAASVGACFRTWASPLASFVKFERGSLAELSELLCHVSGWLAPMYGAGKLESRNVREYETAARHALACGRDEWVDCLLTMAEVEWEHEAFFRSRVLSHRVGRRLRIWPALPPKEAIRESFERDAQALRGRRLTFAGA